MSLPNTCRPSPAAASVAVAFALLAASAHASEERFRLLPGSVMQNDDNGVDGTTGYARGLGYEVMQGYAIAEGDMVLGRVDGQGRLEVPFRPRGLGQRSTFDRWPDGIVPYAFHPGISEIQQRNVETAIERLNAKTRIALVAADDPAAEGYSDYILFEPSSGCASYVGRQLTEDAQSLWVADSCSIGSIVHEISHAIGLFHEHTRPDRDNNVIIAWDEIIDDKAFNFEIYDAGAESWGDYDYDSIMHYGEYFFSKSGRRTIIAPANRDIGQRVGLSASDIETIDRMYATDLALDTNVFESDRGLEIDISITNAGDLGARDLTLRVLGDVGTDWLSVSADSGWNCLAYDEELRCERSRLIEQAGSRFTVVADPRTTGAEGLAFRLESVTLDTDMSNNGSSADVFSDTDENAPAPSSAGLATASPDESTPVTGAATPTAGAAVPDASEPTAGEPDEPTRATTTTSTDRPTARSSTEVGGEAGGGASGFAPLVLLGALACRRRRRCLRATP